MKNGSLLLISTLILSINQNFIFPMKINSQTINLRLDAKPQNKSTYEWCCDIIEEHVKEKKEKVLKTLNINGKDWDKIKKPLEEENLDFFCHQNNSYYKSLQINFPNEIRESIFRTIENENVKKIFEKLKSPEQEKDAIEIRAIPAKPISNTKENNQKQKLPKYDPEKLKFKIKFLSMPKESQNIITISEGYNIFISLTIFFNASRNWLKKSSLECKLGHELAHILCRHSLEGACFDTIFEESKQINSNVSFKNALKEWVIATEAQADIIGIFNNKKWAQDQYNCYTEKSNLVSDIPEDRLPFSEIKKYFKEILESMEKEEQNLQIYKNTNSLTH